LSFMQIQAIGIPGVEEWLLIIALVILVGFLVRLFARPRGGK